MLGIVRRFATYRSSKNVVVVPQQEHFPGLISYLKALSIRLYALLKEIFCSKFRPAIYVSPFLVEILLLLCCADHRWT